MYERFYDLRERPFALSPDPSYLYQSKAHGETLSYLRYGIEGYAGFVVITGEVGSGKTTLLQTALRRLDQQTSISRLMSTMLDARELLEAVMLDFGLDPPPGASKPRLLRDLARFLVNQRSAGHLALLVIDEAQNLTLAALEEVRMLSNFETERSKLMQIVLVGQPSLRDTLARPELEQLRQRVTVSYHLRALDRAETAGYINYRLGRAAIGVPLEFPVDVTDLIYRHSRGVPRTINVIADAVLMYGYGEDRRQISADLAEHAIADLIENRVLPPLTGTLATAGPTSPEKDLLAREIGIQQRERQLAEQQRILDEQVRMLAAAEMQARTLAPRVAASPASSSAPTSSSLASSAVASSTVPPSTVASSTVPPSTVASSAVASSAVASSTVPPSTVPPSTAASSTTPSSSASPVALHERTAAPIAQASASEPAAPVVTPPFAAPPVATPPVATPPVATPAIPERPTASVTKLADAVTARPPVSPSVGRPTAAFYRPEQIAGTSSVNRPAALAVTANGGSRVLPPLRTAPLSKYLLQADPITFRDESAGIWARLCRGFFGTVLGIDE